MTYCLVLIYFLILCFEFNLVVIYYFGNIDYTHGIVCWGSSKEGKKLKKSKRAVRKEKGRRKCEDKRKKLNRRQRKKAAI